MIWSGSGGFLGMPDSQELQSEFALLFAHSRGVGVQDVDIWWLKTDVNWRYCPWELNSSTTCQQLCVWTQSRVSTQLPVYSVKCAPPTAAMANSHWLLVFCFHCSSSPGRSGVGAGEPRWPGPEGGSGWASWGQETVAVAASGDRDPTCSRKKEQSGIILCQHPNSINGGWCVPILYMWSV